MKFLKAWPLALLVAMSSSYSMAANKDALTSNDSSPALSFSPRLGDRYFVKSVLTEVFGPDSNSIVDKAVFAEPSIFGGNCDPYETVEPGKHEKCKVNSHTELGISSVVRQGKIMSVCEALAKNPATAAYALKRSLPAEGGQQINETNISAMYFAFNAGKKKIPGEVLKSLSAIDRAKNEIQPRWQKIIFVLCSDPGWQLL